MPAGSHSLDPEVGQAKSSQQRWDCGRERTEAIPQGGHWVVAGSQLCTWGGVLVRCWWTRGNVRLPVGPLHVGALMRGSYCLRIGACAWVDGCGWVPILVVLCMLAGAMMGACARPRVHSHAVCMRVRGRMDGCMCIVMPCACVRGRMGACAWSCRLHAHAIEDGCMCTIMPCACAWARGCIIAPGQCTTRGGVERVQAETKRATGSRTIVNQRYRRACWCLNGMPQPGVRSFE